MNDKPKTDLQLAAEAWETFVKAFNAALVDWLRAPLALFTYDELRERRKRTKWPPHANLRDFRRQ